jgi:hypothetical protein
MRCISFSLTTPQFIAGTKDVTRRVGWEKAKAGDPMKAVEKAMGLKKGQAMVIIGQIEIIDARRERLDRMITDRAYGIEEVKREGFPDMSPEDFIAFFCRTHAGCFPEREITRLEFVKR